MTTYAKFSTPQYTGKAGAKRLNGRFEKDGESIMRLWLVTSGGVWSTCQCVYVSCANCIPLDWNGRMGEWGNGECGYRRMGE